MSVCVCYVRVAHPHGVGERVGGAGQAREQRVRGVRLVVPAARAQVALAARARGPAQRALPAARAHARAPAQVVAGTRHVLTMKQQPERGYRAFPESC